MEYITRHTVAGQILGGELLATSTPCHIERYRPTSKILPTPSNTYSDFVAMLDEAALLEEQAVPTSRTPIQISIRTLLARVHVDINKAA